MKFEDLIKQKVEQHQEAYDPKAWEALSSKIGSTAAKSASTLKWWIAAASVFVAIIGCVVFYNTGNQQIKPTQQIKEINADNTNTEITTEKSDKIVSEKAIAEKTTVKESLQLKETENIQKGIDNNLTKVDIPENTKKTLVINEPTVVKTKGENKIHINWATKICSNEVVVLKNDNDVVIKLENSSSSRLINAHQSIKSNDLKAGLYNVLSNNGSLLQTLEIFEVPKLGIISEEIIFDKGIPFIPARITNDDISSYQWNLKGQQISTKREVLIPAFDKGNIKIDFSGVENNCPINEVFNVTVREDYNLLAVNAFNVESRDERNRTFLPFALYERNDAFEMQIIDPKTGEVIFKTNSTESPWNGIDSRTGELVTPNTRYVWTVSMARKVEFETKAVYQGVIVRVVY